MAAFTNLRSGSTTAIQALSCQLTCKKKKLSTSGWSHSRALPCKCNSSPSTKTWWRHSSKTATEKCLSITLLRLTQNFSPTETWDFDFLKLRNILCYISLDKNVLLTGKISRGCSHHKWSKSINHMGFFHKIEEALHDLRLWRTTSFGKLQLKQVVFLMFQGPGTVILQKPK